MRHKWLFPWLYHEYGWSRYGGWVWYQAGVGYGVSDVFPERGWRIWLVRRPLRREFDVKLVWIWYRRALKWVLINLCDSRQWRKTVIK